MNADGNAGPGLRQTQIYDRLNGLMGSMNYDFFVLIVIVLGNRFYCLY
jgi:hypothetical protein